MKDMLMIVFSDSLLDAPRSGLHHERVWDSRESFQVCKCIFFGGSLMGGALKGNDYHNSLMSMAKRVVDGEDPKVQRYLSEDPVVRVVVVKAANSTAQCREPVEEEQFPKVVSDRRRAPLVSSLETDWSVLDLEDVVQQREGRKRFRELEPCRLRNKRGLYGKSDPLHFRPSIKKAANDELLKGIRRTAISRHGNSIKDGGVIIVIAAGWNVEDENFASLDRDGKAWRRAELLAAAELCALDGRNLSAFRRKISELLRWRRGRHHELLKKSVSHVKYTRPPPRQVGRKIQRQIISASVKRKRQCSH